MAFNLTDENGVSLKNKPSNKPNGKSYPSDFNARLKYALEQETGRTGLSLEYLKRL